MQFDGERISRDRITALESQLVSALASAERLREVYSPRSVQRLVAQLCEAFDVLRGAAELRGSGSAP